MPRMLPVYETLRNELAQRYPQMKITVGKTQISFRSRYIFAMASLPVRRIRGCPDEFLLVSFGLSRRLEDDRIFQAVEPCPNRWTHHVVVTGRREIDSRLMQWLEEAHQFSMTK
ncbi:MAG: hypothetical protein HPZ89_00820 [Oscillospiraceae bacterium]|nr:hypothetical protein [Oscillospiraceae bacterium]